MVKLAPDILGHWDAPTVCVLVGAMVNSLFYFLYLSCCPFHSVFLDFSQIRGGGRERERGRKGGRERGGLERDGGGGDRQR